MGSRFISRSAIGYNMSDGFGAISREDEERYGNDYYSGHFGSAYLGRTRSINSGLISEKAEKEVRSILAAAQDDDNGYGNSITGLDVGIVEYEIITVKKKTIKKTENTKPKWEMYYRVYDIYTDKVLYESKDKKLATDKMLELAITHRGVELFKEPILVKGSSAECGVTVSVKKSKKKPARIPQNAVLKEAHRYVFYGWVKE